MVFMLAVSKQSYAGVVDWDARRQWSVVSGQCRLTVCTLD